MIRDHIYINLNSYNAIDYLGYDLELSNPEDAEYYIKRPPGVRFEQDGGGHVLLIRDGEPYRAQTYFRNFKRITFFPDADPGLVEPSRSITLRLYEV